MARVSKEEPQPAHSIPALNMPWTSGLGPFERSHACRRATAYPRDRKLGRGLERGDIKFVPKLTFRWPSLAARMKEPPFSGAGNALG